MWTVYFIFYFQGSNAPPPVLGPFTITAAWAMTPGPSAALPVA